MRWFKPYVKDDPMISLKTTDFGEEFEEKFDYLYLFACDVLDKVCEQYKGKSCKEMVAITHSTKICPEWTAPIRHGKHTISIEDLCKHHGKSQKFAQDILDNIALRKEMSDAMDELVNYGNR